MEGSTGGCNLCSAVGTMVTVGGGLGVGGSGCVGRRGVGARASK